VILCQGGRKKKEQPMVVLGVHFGEREASTPMYCSFTCFGGKRMWFGAEERKTKEGGYIGFAVGLSQRFET
jgi:hypothetical protein